MIIVKQPWKMAVFTIIKGKKQVDILCELI